MADDYKNTAVIVLPVKWPSTHPAPDVKDLHVTLAFLGDIDENELVKDDVVDAIMSLDYNVFVMADVIGFDLFGPEQDIPVLRVEHEVFQKTYNQLTDALRERDIPWSQNYAFQPHVTIDHETSINGWPSQLWTTPVELWWRREKVKFL